MQALDKRRKMRHALGDIQQAREGGNERGNGGKRRRKCIHAHP
jgi:hypothetical protein